MKTLIKIFLQLLTIVFFSGGTITTLQAQDNNKASNTDSVFINKNIADNTIEMALAHLGEQKASDPEIKKAAGQVAADHSQILNDLKRIGDKKNVIELNDNTTATKIAAHPALKSLESLTGRDFEKLWLSQMLGTHEAKISEIEMTAGQITDVELKSAVNRALQKIKMHRDMLSRMKYKYQQ